MNKIGSPKGLLMHWFLLELSREIMQNYDVTLDEARHAYCLTRRNRKKFKSVLLVYRTSKKCLRVIYFNLLSGKSVYKSFTSPVKAAEWFNRFGHNELIEEPKALEHAAICNNFARALRRLFRQTHVPQWKLAEFLNVRQQTVSKWRSGVYLPDDATIEKIGNFFEVGFEYFAK